MNGYAAVRGSVSCGPTGCALPRVDTPDPLMVLAPREEFEVGESPSQARAVQVDA